MGQARNRGTFLVRKVRAIAAGRIKVERPQRGVGGGFGVGDMFGLMASVLASEKSRKK